MPRFSTHRERRRRPPGGTIAVLRALFALFALSGCGDEGAVKPHPNLPDPILLPLLAGSAWEYAVADTINGTPHQPGVRTDSLVGVRPFDGEPYFGFVTQGDSPETTWIRQEGPKLLVRPSVLTELPADSSLAGLTGALRASLPWLLTDFSAPAGTSWELLTLADTVEVSGYPLRVSVRVTAVSLGRRSLSVPAGSFDDVGVGRLTLQISYTVLIPLFPVPGGTYTRWEEVSAVDEVGVVQWRSGERTEVPGLPTTSIGSSARLRAYRPAPN